MSDCRRYYLDGDSTINDTSYVILRQTGRHRHSNLQAPNLSYTQWFSDAFVALLREDTIARRVFIRTSWWPVEQLFYDFSVGVGIYPDTYRFDDSPAMQVLAVDTILLTDGPHRRMHLGGQHWIIEGVGSTYGFHAGYGYGEFYHTRQLVCHNLMDAPTYVVNSASCPCGTDVGISTNTISGLRIGPSPTSDVCVLTEAPPNAAYCVRAIDGQRYFSGLCSGNGTAMIDLSNLPAAIYLLEVQCAEGPQSIRVVKE